jgi:hypothetical protein
MGGVTKSGGTVTLDTNQTISGEKTFQSDKLKAPNITSTDDFIVKVPFGKQLVEQQAGGGYSYQHFPFDFAARSGVTAPADVLIPGTTLYGWSFNNVQVNNLYTKNSFGMPHNIAEGVDGTFNFIYAGSNNTGVDTQNIVFKCDWYYLDLANPSAFILGGNLEFVVPNKGLDGSSNPIFYDVGTTLDLSGISSTIAYNIGFRFYRDTADGRDDYGSPAFVVGINPHLPLTSIGSRQEKIR